MTTPLAIVYYENLLPGSQLINKLQDLGYRVQNVGSASDLPAEVAAQKPLVVIMELESKRADVIEVIQAIRGNSDTAHVPVLAYAAAKQKRAQAAAREAGATLIADESGLLTQLPQLLEHVLRVD